MRILAIAVSLATLSVMSLSAEAMAAKRTLRLHQDKPQLAQVDLGKQGNSHGDMLAFEAAVSGEGGMKGTMQGVLVTVSIAEGGETFEDRTGQIYIDLGGGNSLVVAGHSVYKDGSQEMEVGVSQIRAVIGGTGDYMGSTGQVTTTRNADGSYDHVVELID
jgi:uncharacterized protein YdeI (BOF family)